MLKKNPKGFNKKKKKLKDEIKKNYLALLLN
jgi:hypothetical protein